MLEILILTLLIVGAFGYIVRFVVRSITGTKSSCHGASENATCQACLQAQQMRQTQYKQ